MIINVSQNQHQVRIDVEGDIDERGSEEMKKRFRELPMKQIQQVTVNFAHVTHIGSAGIGKLLIFYKELAMQGGRLSIINVPSVIYQLLCEMKLDTIIHISELSTSSLGEGGSAR